MYIYASCNLWGYSQQMWLTFAVIGFEHLPSYVTHLQDGSEFVTEDMLGWYARQIGPAHPQRRWIYNAFHTGKSKALNYTRILASP